MIDRFLDYLESEPDGADKPAEPATTEDLSACRVKEALPDAPVSPEAVVPTGYELSESGITHIFTSHGQERRKSIARAPILIRSIQRDVEENRVYIELACRADGKWTTAVVPRRTAVSATVISLADYGFPIHDANRRSVLAYIQSYEEANDGAIPQRPTSSRLGWHDKRFLLGDRCIANGDVAGNELEFRAGSPGEMQIGRSVRQSGTIEKWEHAIRSVSRYPRVVFAVYASLASPLLRILKIPSFLIDYAGPSTTGKTTALYAGASVWGCPAEDHQKSYMKNWSVSDAHHEVALATLQNLPLFLNESQHANSKDVARFVYRTAEGHGKGRGLPDGGRADRMWNLITFSSGEVRLTSMSQREAGGAHVRVVTLWGSPLGGKSPKLGKKADTLKARLGRNYGQAGPIFLERLVKRLPDKAWRRTFRSRFRRLKERYTNKSDENCYAARQAECFAVVHLAAELAHNCFNWDWDPSTILDEVWSAASKEVESADTAWDALKSVYEYACSHESEFHRKGKKGKNSRTPPGGWLGIWGTWKKSELICFIPARLHEVLSRSGYSKDNIDEWHRRRWLRTNESKRNTYKVAKERRAKIPCTHYIAIDVARYRRESESRG